MFPTQNTPTQYCQIDRVWEKVNQFKFSSDQKLYALPRKGLLVVSSKVTMFLDAEGEIIRQIKNPDQQSPAVLVTEEIALLIFNSGKCEMHLKNREVPHSFGFQKLQGVCALAARNFLFMNRIELLASFGKRLTHFTLCKKKTLWTLKEGVSWKSDIPCTEVRFYGTSYFGIDTTTSRVRQWSKKAGVMKMLSLQKHQPVTTCFLKQWLWMSPIGGHEIFGLNLRSPQAFEVWANRHESITGIHEILDSIFVWGSKKMNIVSPSISSYELHDKETTPEGVLGIAVETKSGEFFLLHQDSSETVLLRDTRDTQLALHNLLHDESPEQLPFWL